MRLVKVSLDAKCDLEGGGGVYSHERAGDGHTPLGDGSRKRRGKTKTLILT